MISDMEKESSYVQAENKLGYLIREKRMPNLKRGGQVIKAQATTTEQSQIYVSQQYRWYMTIEVEWEDLRLTNSPRDIFTCLSYYFQFNLDETFFLCN